MKFLNINSHFVFVLIVFQFAFAQVPTNAPSLPPNTSQTCQVELAQLIANKDLTTCAPVANLQQLPTASATNQKSILDSFCSSPNCNDTLLNSSVAGIESQCSTDLTAKNQQVTQFKNFLVFYTPSKQALCFKNSTGYCDSDPNSAALLAYISGLTPTVPTSIDCSDCNKAILNTFINYFKANPASLSELNYTQADLTSFTTPIATKCNATFLDGTIPTSLNSSSTSSSPTGSSPTPSKPSSSSDSIYNAPSFMSFTIILALFIISIAYVI